MYTKGILKIFVPSNVFAGKTSQDVFDAATAAGFKIASFNGIIFIKDVKDGRKWIETAFDLTDFEVN